ncbi:hypothetical protein T265_06645 [Opisthorchis viverrini]|uniref:Uncharacterized protein n=1 Tax=Opisthorchis viverrini TaxID=6198 RepID=A0A075ADE1_OPIVI|nr:hypothetical protein T265_06645 [Opisthorchis viverrini]KER26009.1 hypothetical protein T265_06645 [Opisthorchis viverrini]
MLSRRANKHQGIITLDTANKFERVTQPGCLKMFYNRRNQGDRDNYSWKVRNVWGLTARSICADICAYEGSHEILRTIFWNRIELKWTLRKIVTFLLHVHLIGSRILSTYRYALMRAQDQTSFGRPPVDPKVEKVTKLPRDTD